jgi:hypothetical protein
MKKEHESILLLLWNSDNCRLDLLLAIQVQTLDRTGDSGSTPGQALLR